MFVPRVARLKDYSNINASQLINPQNAFPNKSQTRNNALSKTKSEENYTLPTESASAERKTEKQLESL